MRPQATYRALRAREARRPRLSRRDNAIVGAVTAAVATVWLATANYRATPVSKRTSPWWSEFDRGFIPFISGMVGFNVLCSQPGYAGAALAGAAPITLMLFWGDEYPDTPTDLASRLHSLKEITSEDAKDLVIFGASGGLALWSVNRVIARLF